ncbi:hypothetical protein FACS1894208_08980 [Clostridia bacterium]|nr:hypothetical protein FACS1894208_08980 [Clostridia bacterium]
MNTNQELVTVIYEGEETEVTREVADFLNESRKQQEKQDRSDRRHLTSKSLEENFFEDDVADERADIEGNYIQREDYRQLHAAIDTLPEVQRRRLTAYYFEGLPYRKIAELEGVSDASIRESIVSAMKTLKTFLG